MSSGSFEDVTVDGAKLVGDNTNGLVMNGNFVAKNGASIDLSVADGDSNAWNRFMQTEILKFTTVL